MPDTKTLLRETRDRIAPPQDVMGGLQRRRERRIRNQRVAAGILGIAVFALAAFGFVRLLGSGGTPAIDPPVVPSPDPKTSGGMWPQTSLEEVRRAQERADAGDPDYTWQHGPPFSPLDAPVAGVQLELVDRFIREVLGWEAYRINDFVGGDADGWGDGDLTDQRYLRCAPSRTNPLYPDESCAPTIDDLHYETVSLDIAQLDRQGRDGIWVVSGWRLTAPFTQADPAVVEARARQRLEEFLAARVAGTGADGYVQVIDYAGVPRDVPLLYASTSGATYERSEIERVVGPRWPYAYMTFSVRLFADGDATVVEQEITWHPTGLGLDVNSTTENGQPVPLSYTSSDGEVTVSAPSTWFMWWHEPEPHVDVWHGVMGRGESGESIGFVDPVAYDAWCADNGGSPLLSGPADAASIAQQVIADPNFETTAPVTARIGGLKAVSIDVALAPDGKPCGIGIVEIARWIHELWEPGLRLRLYLVDLPEGMSVETLAITIVAPEERFEALIEETAPIIDSIEFHTP